MLQAGTARLADQVSASGIAPKYKRHRPEQTLLSLPKDSSWAFLDLY